jgi:hypothetical protein
MIDTEKYQPARQNMKLVTRSLCSLANKLHILAQQADVHIQITYTYTEMIIFIIIDNLYIFLFIFTHDNISYLRSYL